MWTSRLPRLEFRWHPGRAAVSPYLNATASPMQLWFGSVLDIML